jgi:gamma-glutamyl hercynylcysteine S-oxide synthase
MPGIPTAIDIDTARMRSADAALLSLALIAARNRSLQWIALLEAPLDADAAATARRAGFGPVAWEAGRLGWAQERDIARNLHRASGGAGADDRRPHLASVLPESDASFDAAGTAVADRWGGPMPDLPTIRHYLVDTLETTLELLERAPADDDGLRVYRRALFAEDAACERFAEFAQAVGRDARALVAVRVAPLPRPPLFFPAHRIQLGSPCGGYVFDNERWAHEVALPEFEIDAQPVDWRQYGEFVADGGYDDPRHWSTDGWAWVQANGRRTPRHVGQMRQGVLLQRFGQLVRAPLAQAAVHVTAHEAEAWCRWAGRRLPFEAEWEAAAIGGAGRGWRWGDVREWTASRYAPYPLAPGVARPGVESTVAAAIDATVLPPPPAQPRVLRGASFATPGRLRHPKARGGRAVDDDSGFSGFRSGAS